MLARGRVESGAERIRRRRRPAFVAFGLAALAAAGCGERDGAGPRGLADASAQAQIERTLELHRERIESRADSIDRVFKPLPLLTAAQEAALRRYGNDAHLARARRYGVPRPSSDEELLALQQAGRLVELEPESRYWVVRELEYSLPYVTPDTRTLLEEIGERFQTRLAELGAPPFRLEISSVLRTAEIQAALRRSNPNAARGTSAHEFGTTVDIAYAAFAAPVDPIVPIDVPDAPRLRPHLEAFARTAAERVAARRALELKAVLGTVLRELQAEGRVLVTLERLQPVYHLTLAAPRRAAQ